jgi:fluoroquinolone transport system ATP-binding protein
VFQVSDLRFRYPNNREDTIKGISFDVLDGEVFGLLGPSGVGKSTTQRILIKLLDRSAGEVLYKGRDIRSYGKDFYQEIGVGFEMPVHFSKLTAEENLSFFKKLYKSSANTDKLMEQVGLLKDKNKKVAEFSKGMKVRLNFVRALLNNPRILFLDEPTNGLDPHNARIVKDMIRDFKRNGGTVLLTTHLMSDVDELCDRIAFMAGGRIAETDSPKNLKLKYGERKIEVEYGDNGEVSKASFDLDSFGRDEAFLDIVQNKRVVTVHSEETTLDDIFIKVTGVVANE